MKPRWLSLLLVPLALSTAVAAQRIITIGGDVTRIVCALNAQQDLVARDSTSLHPISVQKLPDVGYMRQLNAEGILALRPTLVLASELAKPTLALQQVAQNGVKVVDISGESSLSAIDDKIRTIASALHREPAGEALREKMRQQLNSVPATPLPVRVLFILAHQGMSAMAAGQGTAADAAIRAAGLTNAMGSLQRYQPLSQEGVIASAPQLIVMTADGVRTLGGKDKLWQLPGMAFTPAGKQRQLLVVDDMALLGFGIDTPAAILTLRQAAQALP